jgi:hypothetical protein
VDVNDGLGGLRMGTVSRLYRRVFRLAEQLSAAVEGLYPYGVLWILAEGSLTSPLRR